MSSPNSSTPQTKNWFNDPKRFWNQPLSFNAFLLFCVGFTGVVLVVGAALRHTSESDKRRLIRQVQSGNPSAMAEALRRIKW